MSFTDTFLTLKPTLSPGRASLKASWCISTDFTSVVMFTGAKVTTMPGLRIPVSTRPTGTVPIPVNGHNEGQITTTTTRERGFSKTLEKLFLLARDGNEGDGGRVVADLLDVGADFLDDLIVPLLAVGWLRGVHLVDANDELLDAQRIGQQGVFAGLPVFGDARLEFPYPSSYNQDSTVGLRGGDGARGEVDLSEDNISFHQM
ncbi:hypothetical protein E2320_009524 [Naja naja]|nr:hypothetical protein E2320_009524 [Naja naja]